MYDITGIVQAQSVEEAIAALHADPEAVVIAGGSDVLIKVREGKLAGCRMVSIHGIKALDGITMTAEGNIEIGPLTTFRHVTYDEIIRTHIPVLGEAVDWAGGPQLRAVGTIGGNVCNGITSADSASTLMALDAILRVQGTGGVREISIAQWYKGVGKVALSHDELLVKIIIPRANYQGFSGYYIKYAMRNAMDIATLGLSCLVQLSPDKTVVQQLRLAFGVAGPVPMRAPLAEAAATGLGIDEAIAILGKTALEDVNPRDSWRASRAFRLQLVEELSGRALREAARRGGAAL